MVSPLSPAPCAVSPIGAPPQSPPRSGPLFSPSHLLPQTKAIPAIDAVFNGGTALGWAVIGALGVINLICCAGELHGAVYGSSPLERARKVAEYGKKFFVASTFMVGVVANVVQWTHSVNWISIGALATTFQIVGFGASAVVAGVGTVDAVRDLCAAHKNIDAAPSEELEERAKEMQRLACLDLIWNVTTVAWGVLGCASAVGALAVSPFVMGGVLVVSSGVWAASYAYREHKGFLDPKDPMNLAQQHLRHI